MRNKLTAAALLLVLMLALSAFLYQSSQRWEYMVTTEPDTNDKPVSDQLKFAGGAGWELVAVESGPKGRTYFFKRPKQ